jgi:hypothetical protein
LANISRNPNNKEEDFSKYKSDKEMSEVISRIRKDKLPPDEFKYVSDLYMYDIHMARMAEDFKEKLARKELAQKKRLTKMAEQQEITQTRLLKSIKILIQQGETIASISEALDISMKETTELVERINLS